MKYVWFIIILVLFTGCERDREERTVYVAVSLAGTDPITAAHYVEGISDAAGNGKITVDWRNAMMNPDLQKRQIDTLIAEEPDIIAVEITGPPVTGELLHNVKREGIPVIGFNRLVPGYPYDLIISSDYKAIGSELASIITEKYGSDETNILILHGILSAGQESVLIEKFLDETDAFDNFNVTMFEQTERVDVPGLQLRLRQADIVVAANYVLTRRLVAEILSPDNKSIEHRSPLIIGFGERELFAASEIGYDNLILIDRQPYTAAARLIDAAAGYARGAFRHHDGPVIRIGEYMIPVIYTPHRIDSTR